MRISVKGTSACTELHTQDPIGRAILASLEEYAVSVYVEGIKLG